MRMKTLDALLLLTIATAIAGTAAAQTENGCVTCHAALDDAPLSVPAMDFAIGVHAKWDITCVDCHGGNAGAITKIAAKSPSTRYRATPSATEVPALCGSCHSDSERMHAVNPASRTDQEAQYYTSVHGRQLRGGDTNVATCVSCHGVHGILSADDPRSPVYPRNIAETCDACHGNAELMSEYGIPTDQGEGYRQSVHANAMYQRGDLSAPTCSSCHGNHGAAPPGVSHISAVCRQCHVTQADIFDESVHKEIFVDSELPECTSCHGNHAIVAPTDEMVGDSDEAVCLECHFEGDVQIDIAVEIHGMLTRLADSIAVADSVLTRAAIAGMEASEGMFTLRGARDGLITARNVVHSVDPASVAEIYEPALEGALEARVMGVSLLEEVSSRRVGLVVALILIAIYAIALYFKIRETDRQNPPRVPDPSDS